MPLSLGQSLLIAAAKKQRQSKEPHKSSSKMSDIKLPEGASKNSTPRPHLGSEQAEEIKQRQSKGAFVTAGIGLDEWALGVAVRGLTSDRLALS